MPKINRSIFSIYLFIFIFFIIINNNNSCLKKSETVNINNKSLIIKSLSNVSERWRVLPIRSYEEYKMGKMGGEAEQHLHSIARSLSNPNIIYLSHDVSGAWKSLDAGKTWKKTVDIGLFTLCGQSIEVDPVDYKTVFFIVDNCYNWLAKNFSGIYRSRDMGDSWELVLKTKTNYNSKIHRIYRHNIAYDLSSIKDSKVQTWYAAFPGIGLFRSDDAGDTWGNGPVSSLKGHRIVYAIYVHPANSKVVYVATAKGLFVSYTRGSKLISLGNFGGECVSSIGINHKNPSILYITVKGKGLFISKNGGLHFSKLIDFDAARVFVNPGFPEVIYLVGISSNMIISHDGGATWVRHLEIRPSPGLGRMSRWKSKIAGELSGVVPNSKNPLEAIAYSRATIWKTQNGGKLFYDSSTFFTGFAWSWWNNGVAFDNINPDRLAFFNNDVGMTITHNRGLFFELRNSEIWQWYKKGLVSWIGTYSGSFQPIADSKIIVASVGGYFNTKIMRSDNEGKTWNLIPNQEPNRNLFISFHLKNPNIVYAGNKISRDTGKTFQKVDFREFNPMKPSILGMCRSNPDTVYAMDLDRSHILRSDDMGKRWRLYARPGWNFKKMDSLPTFAVDPKDCDKIYTIDASGDLASFNGKKWKSSGVLSLAGGEKVGNFVRTIAIDTNHPNIIYAGMNASGISCIWRSTDSGTTWKDITYNLPRNGMSSIAVNPHTGELYKGSLIGTWIFPPPYTISKL